MQKKQKNKKKKKDPQKSNTHFWGDLENGQEVVPPFLPKKGVLQYPQNPYFLGFPKKMGGRPLFSKRPMLQGGHILRGKKLFCCCCCSCCYSLGCFVFVVVVVFLTCYVAKLGKANKNKKWNKKNSPKKVEVLPGIFTRQVMAACAKVIGFLWFCFVVLPYCCQNTIKIGLLMILKSWF